MWPFKKKKTTFEERILHKCKDVKKWERKVEQGGPIIYSSLEIPFEIQACRSIGEIIFDGGSLRVSNKFLINFYKIIGRALQEDKLKNRLLLEAKILNAIESGTVK